VLPDGNLQTNNFLSILNTGAVLFNNSAWKRQNVSWDIKSQLLTTHLNGKESWEKMEVSRTEPGSAFYKEEGHFILRKRSGADKEIYCHFDAAPLGYLSIAAHGHADALSVILHVDGHPFLVDPGTYAYHTHSDWRKYYTSTIAHNTVAIDKADQATLAGPTLWLNHFDCKVITTTSTPDKDIITASHNGYASKGVSHTRIVAFDKTANVIRLTDRIEAAHGNYLVNLPLHLHPDVIVVSFGANSWLLKHAKTSAKVEVTFDRILTGTMIHATEGQQLGWYSGSFMKKEKSIVLMGETYSGKKELSLQTIIKVFN